MQSCRLRMSKLPTLYIEVADFVYQSWQFCIIVSVLSILLLQHFRYYYFSTFDTIVPEQRKFCSKRNEKIIEGRWCSYSRGNIEGWNSAWFAKQEKGRNLMAFTLPLFNYLLCYLTLALCQCPKAKVYLFIPFMVNEMRLRFTSTSVTFTITC